MSRDLVMEVLRRQLEAAQRRHEDCMEQFRNLAGRQRELPRIPGGNPGSDGDVIRQAMTAENEAKEAFIAALENLNRFVESGIIPADIDDPESGGDSRSSGAGS